MSVQEPPLTMGVEEEYLLVDLETGNLAQGVPDVFIEECTAELGEQVSPEFLQAQVEIGTRVCGNISEVRAELKRLRSGVVRIAANHGLPRSPRRPIRPGVGVTRTTPPRNVMRGSRVTCRRWPADC